MSKNKTIITESQYKAILNEELGIAKEVSKASRILKKELFDRIEVEPEGEFNFLDITVKYHVYSFDSEKEFFEWYNSNAEKYINGFSFNIKRLALTIIVIDGNYNIASLNDTIQHELEHYYQCKMAGHSFVKPSYRSAIERFYDYNDYVKYVSRLEYYSNHIEIDAYVNGAYFAAQELEISDYKSFIESTDLKQINNALKEIYSFFKNAPFKGIYFNEMLEYIKRYGFFRECKNIEDLRKNICVKCEKTYKYFVRKSSRAYALIQNQNEERIKTVNNIKLNF